MGGAALTALRTGDDAVEAPHVVIVNQNVPLERDLRPRREAEALAAAGYDVTLLGGCQSAERVRDMIAADVNLELFDQPRDGNGVRGQIREQNQALARAVAALRRAGRRAPVSAVHAGNPPDNLFLARWALRPMQGFTPRFVYDQHDAAPVLLGEKFPGSPLRAPLKFAASAIERRSFAAAHLVVFSNAEFRARAIREGLLRSDSEVVLNGWSLPEVSPDPRWRAGAEHVLAYVGMIGEQDNVDHLVDAVAVLRRRFTLKVIVAGAGPAFEAVRQHAARRGVQDSFEWLGYVDERDRIAELVRSADVCVAPEIDSDFNRLATFVKIIEYMSIGMPIAAHRLPQTEALAGDTVCYAPDMTAEGLAAAIGDLLDDRARAGQLGDAARLRFDRRISWDRAGAPRLVAGYDRLFGRRSGWA
jgi:glycosyltransferase involved in cell wall biosynthesis